MIEGELFVEVNLIFVIIGIGLLGFVWLMRTVFCPDLYWLSV